MKKAQTHTTKKSAPFLFQAVIFAAVLFAAHLIATWISPYFLLPTPVAGLILLYLLLTCHIIKLEWVDSLSGALIGIIGFLFVPSEISLIADLDIMAHEGVQLVLTITVATILLLVITTYTTAFLARFVFRTHRPQRSDKNHTTVNQTTISHR